jgi:CubicO group peptidase (beta-lactamase class C family)
LEQTVRNKQTEQLHIGGTVAPGFESLKQLFEHNMKTLAEKNAQLCVYVGNERVVDLWASATGDTDFNADSLVNVFSSGKSLESIALASLVAKGLLNYNDTITAHWPEFGAEGKDNLTVAELMRHEAGLAAFNVSLDPEALLKDNIKQNSVGSVIESHRQKFREGDDSAREYHAVTRGWIVNEVFRRVDPAHRTIGEFLQEEVSGPLGADAVIGVQQQDLPRISAVSPLGIGAYFLASCRPRIMGRKVQENFFQLSAKLLRLLPVVRHGTTTGAPAPITDMKIESFNDPAVAMGETPSANAHCSARGLAHIAAAMASGGQYNGKEVLSADAWQAMHEAPVQREMLGLRTSFTQGGVAHFSATDSQSSKLEHASNQGREGFYGWMGLGGSLFQWHPEKKIGFSFVPTSLHVLDVVNERGKAYQAEILKCLESD